MIIPAIGVGPLGQSEWSIPGISGLGSVTTGGTSSTGAAGSFGDALSNAISSLDATQVNAGNAAQQLATGQLSDPTTAITAVENASLSMDFASQVRNALDTDATTLMQSSF